MAELFNIVKGVPLPPINRAPKGARRKYPVATMEIGDWFFVAGRSTKSVSAYISRTTKAMTAKFTTRPAWAVQNDNKWVPAEPGTPGAAEGTGVWRVE